MDTRTIDGKTFTLVTKQRRGGAVYRAGDEYLRIGDKSAVEHVLKVHKHLEANGFPVPQILKEGELEGETYFVESSLGDKRFLEIFEQDTNATGSPTEEHFDAFLNVVEKFLMAQIRSEKQPVDAAEFARVIQLDRLCAELPEYAVQIRAQFGKRLEKLIDFPYVVTHVDFNPANMYPAGVIDFEDTSTGPLGFDAATAITVQGWFPPSKEFEYFERYRFTDEQRNAYFAHCDKILIESGYPALSPHYEDFSFFRAIWLTVGMAQWPKLQKHRYELFISKYLA